MLNKEDYKQYIKDMRKTGLSIEKISLLCGISRPTANKALKGEEIMEISKIKIENGYDIWTANRVKSFNS